MVVVAGETLYVAVADARLSTWQAASETIRATDFGSNEELGKSKCQLELI